MENTQKKTERSLLITLGVIVVLVIAVAIVGFLFINEP